MPKVGLRESFELMTRDKYTKINCEIGMTCDGRELPNMAVLGGALEEAIALFQERITESYKVVPARNEFEQPQASQPSTVTQLPEQPVQLTEDEGAVSVVTPKPQPVVPFGN